MSSRTSRFRSRSAIPSAELLRPDLPALWRAHLRAEPWARDRLLAAHLGLVHYVARRIHRAGAASVELEELVSAGTVGLIEAFDGFDPGRGLAFSTYATPRIRGAVLDELRRQDPASRGMRRKIRAMDAAAATVARRAGREPSACEVASALGIEVGELWSWRAEAEGVVQLSLDPSAPESVAAMAATPDDIDALLSHTEELAQLHAALERLTAQERTVLTLYYFEELKLREIGAVLGVTESRVSQIHSKALGKLRAELALSDVAAA